jgi:pyruvate formate lyase activating enzyme
LAQPEFVRDLLEACRDQDVRSVLDTCGHAPAETFRELASLASRLLLDLKLMDSIRHERYTGVGNGWILENIRWLASSGIPFTIRIPLIPGVNDDDENLMATGKFLAGLDSPPPVDVLPYHRLGVGKYGRLGLDYKLAEVETPSKDGVLDVVELLRGFGLRVTVRGDENGDV